MYEHYVAYVAVGFSCILCFSQLAALGTLRAAKKAGVNFSSLPYLVALGNSILWLKYGMLKMDTFILLSNGLGIATSMVVVYYCWNYSIRRGEVEQGLVTILALCALCFIYVDHSTSIKAEDNFGVIASMSSMAFFFAPLSQVRQIIIKKDASSLIPAITAASFGNTLLWTIYGMSLSDLHILIPNAVGLVLSSIQCLLVILYRNSSGVQRQVEERIAMTALA
ncbi:hypothetical protein EV182_003159 [Spiromyces aspiralis]|uniref:Uncharacterized protein n=1 Tax=Spiromyces aspiralis TaxID=68401 RepID=A0ACC1HQT6_9FUNG|nr:hypothetical protein EV182_003159 [Spiromyces aspiralis]